MLQSQSTKSPFSLPVEASPEGAIMRADRFTGLAVSLALMAAGASVPAGWEAAA
jgi:hypothetical protein